MDLEKLPDAQVLSANEASEVESDSVKNYSEMDLASLLEELKKILAEKDCHAKSKEVEALKSSFYKKLLQEKESAGLTQQENPVGDIEPHPLNYLESEFKDFLGKFKKIKAEYNAKMEQEKNENLIQKEQVLAELKALIEKQEDINATFPEFREIQAKWRSIGRVPEMKFRDMNNSYQFYVEQFYDKVQINREMRDLDFKKNLEIKEELCKKAENLADETNIIFAFNELQKLHEQWKETGPVAKEIREEIWERFRAASSVINKKHQAFFEEAKVKGLENLRLKEALCEKVEKMAEDENIDSSNKWNTLSKEIESIQEEWRKIGYATKKENKKIYERFRAACDKFYERKRIFYSDFKENMNRNLEKKLSLIEIAESIKTSTDWKKTTDQFISLQKQWKEIGAVPRKKSEAIWQKFRAACDEFFDNRQKNAKPEDNVYGNLKLKKALIEEINNYVNSEDPAEEEKAFKEFKERWDAIGFVPFKEKDNMAAAFKQAMSDKFRDFSLNERGRREQPKSEKEILMRQYVKLQQEIDNYENNIGFFTSSKNAETLIRQMQEKIEKGKEELKKLENKIIEIQSNQ